MSCFEINFQNVLSIGKSCEGGMIYGFVETAQKIVVGPHDLWQLSIVL